MLEKYFALSGLSKHIDDRDSATFESCVYFGTQVLERAGYFPEMHGQELRDYLMADDGIGRNSVRILEEHEAIEIGGLAIYL